VLGISARLANQIIGSRKKRPLRTHADLYAIPGVNRAAVERIRRKSLLENDTCAIITDVLPTNRRIMSQRPFMLRVNFVAGRAAPPVLARVAVEWAGKPFHIEQRITRTNLLANCVDIRFDRRHTLPSGPAIFRTTLSTRSGGQSEFRVTCLVLPSNPFSLSLSPRGSFVTGTFSARGVRNGNAYDTSINVTLSNGDASAVNVSPQFTWKFWDGGVGGIALDLFQRLMTRH
jgi:hypothetical protein